MRFFYAAIVACFAASVSAQLQDASSADMIDDYSSDVVTDFDISGKMVPPVQQQQLPGQTLPLPTSLPVQHQPIKEMKVKAPIQSAMVKEEKTNTVLLQPIVLLPKKQQKKYYSKSFNVDVDRAFAYKVSPSIHAANARSMDVEFTPILNAKLKNVLLSPQADLQPTSMPVLLPVKGVYHRFADMPIQQELPMKSAPVRSFNLGTMPIQRDIPVQRDIPMQESMPITGLRGEPLTSFQQPISAFPSSAAISGLQWNVNPNIAAIESASAGRFNPYASSGIQATFPLTESDTITSAFRGTADIDYTSLRVNAPSSVPSSTYLLSSYDESLPSIPATTDNLVKLAVSQPLKFKNMYNVCVQQATESIACNQVFKAVKLLSTTNPSVYNDIFRSN